MRHELVKRPSVKRAAKRGGNGPTGLVVLAFLIIGLFSSCAGTAEAAEPSPPVAQCSSDEDCESRGFDGYYGDPCDADCEDRTYAGSAVWTLDAVYQVPVEDAPDAEVACLLAGGAYPLPGDHIEALYGSMELGQQCHTVAV